MEPGGTGGLAVRAAANRVAVVAYSGETGLFREIIELDGSGNILGRMRLDGGDRYVFAMTADGNLYTWDQTLMPGRWPRPGESGGRHSDKTGDPRQLLFIAWGGRKRSGLSGPGTWRRDYRSLVPPARSLNILERH